MAAAQRVGAADAGAGVRNAWQAAGRPKIFLAPRRFSRSLHFLATFQAQDATRPQKVVVQKQMWLPGSGQQQ